MLRSIIRAFTLAGAAALFFMAAVTFLDVVLSKLFNFPVPGSYELVALAQLAAISLGSADTLLSGRHVQVDMFVNKMPKKLRRIINIFVTLLSAILFLTIALESFEYGSSLKEAGEVTGTVKVPLFPFAYILGISALITLLIILFAPKGDKG